MARAALAERAEQDLGSILDWQERANPEEAREFAARVNARCAVVAAQPKMGRPRDDLSPGLRSFVLDRCVFFYRITDDGITIVRIVHGSQDADAIMRDE